MNKIFVSLGSNVGDRLLYLRRAIQAIGHLPRTVIKALSAVYETEPVGKKDQPYFLNLVIELSSDLPPKQLLAGFKAIEQAIGRTKTERWGPREIDLDLVYYGDVVLSEATYTIPHAERGNRKFVLLLLHEIAPDFIDPVLKKTVGEMLQACSDASAVIKTSFSVHPELTES